MARGTTRCGRATLGKSASYSWNRLHLGSRRGRIGERNREAWLGRGSAGAHGWRAHAPHSSAARNGSGRSDAWRAHPREHHRPLARNRSRQSPRLRLRLRGHSPQRCMASTRLSSRRLIALFVTIGCTPMPANTGQQPAVSPVSDTVEARRLFEENIDAIHKRDRARYLATYLHTAALGRNGPAGLELGYEGWSARRDSTWPDTLVARNLRVLPITPGVVYGA